MGGKSKGFSDFEAVDRPVDDLTTKVKIGLKKDKDAGILFDLKAVVKRNGNEVSSGELLGAPGRRQGLRQRDPASPSRCRSRRRRSPRATTSASRCWCATPASAAPSLRRREALVRRRLQSQVNEERGALPTLYLVRGDDDEDENCDHERDRGDLSPSAGTKKKKRDVKVQAPVPTCDGPYKSFGKWSGTVPY